MPGEQFDHDLRRVVQDYAAVEPPIALEQWLGGLPARAIRPRPSPRALVRPLATAAAVITIAALAFGVYWARSGPAASAALPSGQPLTIATEPSPNYGHNCNMASLRSAQMRRSGSEVVFSAYDGTDIAITWPYGTTAWLVDGKTELFAPDGTLIATEGQTLPDLGGGLGVDDRFHVCMIGDRSYP